MRQWGEVRVLEERGAGAARYEGRETSIGTDVDERRERLERGIMRCVVYVLVSRDLH